MARQRSRPPATTHRHLEPLYERCWLCGRGLWKVDTHTRTVATLDSLVHYDSAVASLRTNVVIPRPRILATHSRAAHCTTGSS